jgi:tRNA(Ile)-lysidine synthetase-like protein
MSTKPINLINKTHLAITKQNLVSPRQCILITISGGQDSLCLFFIVLHLKNQWKWHFGLLYCNHFWQIDSFYANSLVLKLGFSFLIPAYLSLPSDNIFSEQKSRIWRYQQFERLSNFYKYETVFTGHTSTDRIETVFIQLLRGTGTRGLSTLDWIRPISRDKLTVSRFSPEVVQHSSFPLCVPIKNVKSANLFKDKNLSLDHQFFQIKFCNQFFLRFQISFLKSNFFYKIKNTRPTLKQTFEQDFLQRFPEKKNKALLENQSFLSEAKSSFQRLSLNLNLPLPLLKPSFLTLFVVTDKVMINEQDNQPHSKNLVNQICLITKEEGLTKVYKVTNLAFEPSYGINRGKNTVALQPNDQSIFYQNTNWIYDKFLFLTLEKTTILTPLYKLNYYFSKKNLLLRSLYNTRYFIFDNYKTFFRLKNLNRLGPNKVRDQRNLNTSTFHCFSSYDYNRNIINLSSRQSQKLSRLRLNLSPLTLRVFLISLLQMNSRTFTTSFTRSTSFIISPRIIFRRYFIQRQVSTVVDKIKFFFSLTYNHRLKSSVKPTFKHYIRSQHDKPSSFIFKTVILNKKPSKILLKYLRTSYWIKFKKNFAELEVFKLKNVCYFKITPFLITSYFFLSNYQQAGILQILYPSITLSFWHEAVESQIMFDNWMFSKQGSGEEKKDLTYTAKLNSVLNVSSLNTPEKNKNLALFLNTNQKWKSGFFLWPKYKFKRHRQRHNRVINRRLITGDNSFFSHGNIAKENSFKKTKNNAKFSNTLNLVTRRKIKAVINCRQLYSKDKTKKFLSRNFLLLNKPIYQMKDYTILFSLPNRYGLICKLNNNIPLVLPNQRGFRLHEGNTKQCFVVRPLLFINRFDLKKLCAFWQLPIYPDQTNEKLVYFRNRIRKQLLPLLRFFFNPQIDKLFLQFAEIANTEQLYLEGLSMHLQQEFQITTTNTFELNLSVFNFIPIAIQRRLLKQFLNQYFTKQIKFFHIQILLNGVSKRKKSPSKLHKQLRDKAHLINRKKFKSGYQIFPEVILIKSLNILSTKEKKSLEPPKVPKLTNKIRSAFFKNFLFVKQGTSTKPPLSRNLVNLDKKLKVRNIFSGKNKLETPQILFFSGVGTCFITSRRFILLSNFLIV